MAQREKSQKNKSKKKQEGASLLRTLSLLAPVVIFVFFAGVFVGSALMHSHPGADAGDASRQLLVGGRAGGQGGQPGGQPGSQPGSLGTAVSASQPAQPAQPRVGTKRPPAMEPPNMPPNKPREPRRKPRRKR
mmetsp:Transcript_51405/g.116906  ORF Transcript_51405/g.116906 Transcript_51405/m.116906 type:complete len:133 (-) Transcript_51405:1394-1792(-)